MRLRVPTGKTGRTFVPQDVLFRGRMPAESPWIPLLALRGIEDDGLPLPLA